MPTAIRHTTALLALATFSGCGLAPYAPPVGTEEARIRFVLPSAAFNINAFVQGRESGTCEGPTMELGKLGGMFVSADTMSFGMDTFMDLPAKTKFERKIPAGKPYSITMQGSAFNRICGFSLAFVPEANAQYEFTMITHTVQFRCDFVPTKLVRDAEGMVAPLAIRTEKQVCGGGFPGF